jgi:hypothetical protein
VADIKNIVMKKHIFFLSLIFVALLSCTKTMDFDDEGLAQQAVVNGIFSPDAPFTVYLTQSGSILIDRQTNPPLEGSMDLFEDGTLIRQFPSQIGHFSATDLQLKAGKNYGIVVTSNGKSINAETTIPYPAEVMSIDTSSIRNKNGSTTTNYKIKVNDPTGDDYYRIVVTNETLVQVKDEVDQNTAKYYLTKSQNTITSDDAVFKSVYNNFGDAVVTHGPENDYFIFPDVYFQGKEYILQFQISTYFNGYIGYGGYGGSGNTIPAQKRIYDRHVVHVLRLSKELYNYLKYLKLYNYYHDNPFSEPISVYSNVKNGVGIFAGFNDDTRFTYDRIYTPYSMDTITIEENPSYGYE